MKTVLRANESSVEDFAWGRLYWFAGGKLGNSKTMTVGQCIIKPGFENPKHRHPNCEEVLHVFSGKIVHYIGEKPFEMNPGDTITISPMSFHYAKNTGTVDAVLMISFSSPDRQSEKE